MKNLFLTPSSTLGELHIFDCAGARSRQELESGRSHELIAGRCWGLGAKKGWELRGAFNERSYEQTLSDRFVSSSRVHLEFFLYLYII